MYRRKNKKKNSFVLLVLLMVTVGIGYAFLSQDLTINGTSKVAASSWHIYFDNLVLNQNNVPLSTGDVDAEIDSVTETDITYTVTLKNPGDFYEFTVDVVNDGTIDAMIGSVSSKLGGVEIDQEHPLPSYLNYSVTYSDGGPIQVNQKLDHNTSETYKVRLEYKTDITASDLPTTEQTLTLSFSVDYVQSDTNAVVVTHPVSFSTDSWDTVIAAVRTGNTSAYHVGDTKEIELGNGLGTHTIRIANTSTPEECFTEGFSQTACGFVLEFIDFITYRVMNPSGEYDGVQYNSGWNVDGWPASSMRTYLNDKNDSTSVLNSLPMVIRNAIIYTTVVSGHGSNDSRNFTSADKLYLLSTHEIWEDTDENPTNGIDYYDTAYNNTRQLDYYANLGVTTSNYSEAVKRAGGLGTEWWLRSATSNYHTYFFSVYRSGYWNPTHASNTYGVSPAFRLAGPESDYALCEQFEYDSWETIVSNAQSNNYSQYKVGCEKKISLGNDLGTYKVRVANNTTPSECGTAGFSQTACGFVLEFVDNITRSVMNSTDTSVGGWPASELRTYLNDMNSSTSIINSFPSTIKNAIIDTTVISGYESGVSTNYTSTDKLYLLADLEITGAAGSYDSLTTSNTRQLDYYRLVGTTSSNRSPAVKYMGTTFSLWWLRNPGYQYNIPYTMIDPDGACSLAEPNTSFGVSPVFRLAE